MPKTIRVKFKKSILYDHLNWPVDAVVDMDEQKAVYLCGTNFCEEVAKDTPLSTRPNPIWIAPKDQATATGNAIAEALKGLVAPAPQPVVLGAKTTAPNPEVAARARIEQSVEVKKSA